jgi:hypothetical protein
LASRFHEAGHWLRARAEDRIRAARTTGRRRILRFTRHWPWKGEITAALERLALLPNPG